MSFLNKLFKSTPAPPPQPEMPVGESFDSFKGKIYPWVKVMFDKDSSNKGTAIPGLKIDVVMKPWLGDLAIFYAVDRGNMFSLMQQKDMPPGMSLDELHNIAVDNLEKDIQFKLRETNFGGYGFTAGGDHEAGAICVPGIWKWVAGELNDSLVVAVPAKDLIMLVPAGNPEKVETLKNLVAEFHKTGQRLLTKQLYHYDSASANWTLYYKGE
ncbi:DUF1444 family protein [Pseudoflavitalea sp. X16]|uniref:DUF1444 family protein n=1 Tax=Paraflavitalea devenefica TaxID=2716334 RepID=UPI0014248BBC|nr:DUF1444 family protein [Paraflavitalea devenefica]NII27974.1 DUF1444 family protein [Paraflavitalea devenefica]